VRIARDEGRITYDPQTGEAAGVEGTVATSAHAMIERFMVAANEAIAVWLHDRGVPALYRVHGEPDAQRVADLVAFARNFGFEAGFPGTLTPLALAAFDAQIAGAPSEPAVRSVLRRTLGPARYTVTPTLHFGLAAPLYLHFTSPLRRYADLSVHRTIKQYLRGQREYVVGDPEVEALGAHINERARAADRAEADRYRIVVAELMTPHIGETYPARITRVRPFGLLVQIDGSLVEGLIPIDALPQGPYQPDAREASLVGSQLTFTIGMGLMARLAATDPSLGRIEFALAE
jgi:ribonuclease R